MFHCTSDRTKSLRCDGYRTAEILHCMQAERLPLPRHSHLRPSYSQSTDMLYPAPQQPQMAAGETTRTSGDKRPAVHEVRYGPGYKPRPCAHLRGSCSRALQAGAASLTLIAIAWSPPGRSGATRGLIGCSDSRDKHHTAPLGIETRTDRPHLEPSPRSYPCPTPLPAPAGPIRA